MATMRCRWHALVSDAYGNAFACNPTKLLLHVRQRGDSDARSSCMHRLTEAQSNRAGVSAGESVLTSGPLAGQVTQKQPLTLHSFRIR
jgi:hypothetical protein